MGNSSQQFQYVNAPHPARQDSEALLKQCQSKALRRSGPGGQHRNKVETAIQLTHESTGVIAEANEKRAQNENRKQAVFRLRVKLALEVRTQIECLEELKLSPIWATRIKNKKISVNPQHADFPELLADALDMLMLKDWEVPTSALELGLSSTQLIKFLNIEPKGLDCLNQQRILLGKRPMRA